MDALGHRVGELERYLGQLAEELRLAHAYLQPDPGSSLTKSRLVMERLVIDVYQREMGKEPRKPMLGEMLSDNQFTRKVERPVLVRMNAVRDMGNLGPHGEPVGPADAEMALNTLHAVVNWYVGRYHGVPADAETLAAPATAHASTPGRARGKGVSASFSFGKRGCAASVVLLASMFLVLGTAALYVLSRRPNTREPVAAAGPTKKERRSTEPEPRPGPVPTPREERQPGDEPDDDRDAYAKKTMAPEEIARLRVQDLEEVVMAYKASHGSFPKSLQEFTVEEGGRPAMREARDLVDPWGVPYKYDPAGRHNGGKKPDIWTDGPAGSKPIGNWTQ